MADLLIRIVPKGELSASDLAYIAQRVADPEHSGDSGPITGWNEPHEATRYYAALLAQGATETPFALLNRGGEPHCTLVGWWIDKRFRGQHRGKKLMDAWAAYLKADGVTGLGEIRIETFNPNYAASLELKRYMLSLFR